MDIWRNFMHRVGWKSFAVSIMALIAILSMMFLNACDNSAEADADEITSSLQSSGSKEKSSSSKKAYPDSFKPNDKEYPYAKIPRIVIETENRKEVEDRETEIPAKLQIWGKKEAESEILDLTIRGRGNTSWGAPKKSYKIEFEKKQKLLGMPKDRDWALIANYADKTLMKNYLAYHFSMSLNAYYAPRCEFVELYLNGTYLGVYLLTETVKISKNRVNIEESDNSYLVEFDKKIRSNEQKIASHVIATDSIGKIFRIHSPKNASKQTMLAIENHIHDFEIFLKSTRSNKNNNMTEWIDVAEFVNHYWAQEFTKNPDACYYTSVFFSWEKDGVIKMGPVWDFDLAFGGHNNEEITDPEGWFIKGCYWNRFVLEDSVVANAKLDFWFTNKDLFKKTVDVVDSIYGILELAAKNNYKKWDVLQSTKYSFHLNEYRTYRAAVDDLKTWLNRRLEWIESRMN